MWRRGHAQLLFIQYLRVVSWVELCHHPPTVEVWALAHPHICARTSRSSCQGSEIIHSGRIQWCTCDFPVGTGLDFATKPFSAIFKSHKRTTANPRSESLLKSEPKWLTTKTLVPLSSLPTSILLSFHMCKIKRPPTSQAHWVLNEITNKNHPAKCLTHSRSLKKYLFPSFFP